MNNVETIRVCFSKWNNARYISHLDLMRTMTRVFRRARIPLWYTEGFSKHPYITFAAPLSLGYDGLAEYMDFRLESPMEMDEIVRRLNENMPVGIHVNGAAPAVNKVAAIAASHWIIQFPASFAARVEEVLAQDAIEVQKRTKKGTYKTVDIKPMIQDPKIKKYDDTIVLDVILPSGAQSINPSLLIDAIIGEEEVNVRVTRVQLLMEDGNIFV